MSQTNQLARSAAAAPAAAAPASVVDELLSGSRAWRQARLALPDMVSTDDAATLTRTNRETINNWIRAGRCIGLERTVRGYRLPRWQLEPAIHKHLQPIARALGTSEGWALLLFMETPHEALDGRTPRVALEQGEAERVIDLAGPEGTGKR
jgi:hypothetical protein